MELRTKKDMFGNIVWKDSAGWIPKTEWLFDKEDKNDSRTDRQDTPREESETGEDIHRT